VTLFEVNGSILNLFTWDARETETELEFTELFPGTEGGRC